MKKLAIFAAAFVLTLGLAQCKKEQPNAQNLEGKTVHLTVNVNNNGSRADIQDPSSGQYDFKDGDKLYVGYNNAKVEGELTYSTTTSSFSGNLTIAQSGSQRLHFYYLGGSLTPTVSGSKYTVDIRNQTSDYPVISYGTSTINYSENVGSYTTTLLNKCALVKFTLASGTTDVVAVGGMMTQATIDFANPGVVTPGAAGEIKLYAGASDTEKWAILLSQSAVDNAPVAIGDGYLGYMVGVPAIEDNDFAPNINTIDNSETANANVVILNRLTNDYTATNDQVLTGTLANNVKISIADGATVTLGGVSINANGAWTSGNYAGITCVGNATIILKDGTTNTVKGFYRNYPGIHVPEGSTLTIKGGAAGTGKLTASSNGYGAGIGGGYEKHCGNIEIQGGDITANGGEGVAGIGGGGVTSCGTITISGGTIKVKGGDRAAGIGSGAGGEQGEGSSCGAITISGGTVTATGGWEAAGIGSGCEASCGDITISGGIVTATGGKYAAGIGSGYHEASCGAITITTGVTSVTATKGKDAPNSIGAGIGSSCGTVTIGCTLDGNGIPVGGQTGPVTTSPYTYQPQ